MVSRLIRGTLLGRGERLCRRPPPVKPACPHRRDAANAPRRTRSANPLTLAALVNHRMREPEPVRSTGARPPVPVLVLGKGITALGTVRALGRRGIPLYVAGNPGDMVTGSRWYRRLPGPSFAQDSETELAARLESLDIPRLVLLPCSDSWAMEVSRLRPDLRDRFPASVAPTDVLHRLTDKARFAETLAEYDIPHPVTYLLRDVLALESVPDEAFATSFLKPANSGRLLRDLSRQGGPPAEPRPGAGAGLGGCRPRTRADAAGVRARAPNAPLLPRRLHGSQGPCLRNAGPPPPSYVSSRLRQQHVYRVDPSRGSPRRRRVAAAAPFRDRVPRRLQRRIQVRRPGRPASRSSRSTPGHGGTSALRRTAASTSATWPGGMPLARRSCPSQATRSVGDAFISGGISRAAERRRTTAGSAWLLFCARGSAPGT